MTSAVFLDRDGTIIEEMGYINHFSRIKILPGVAEAIKLLKNMDYKIVVVSNQAGVAKGYFTERGLQEMMSYMREELSRRGAEIDGIYYCPHHPGGMVEEYTMECGCRKPKTGMIEKAQKELRIDVSKSFMIGDRFSDVALGNKSGMKSIFVLSGYGMGEYVRYRGNLPEKPDFIFNDLLQAAQFICRYSK